MFSPVSPDQGPFAFPCPVDDDHAHVCRKHRYQESKCSDPVLIGECIHCLDDLIDKQCLFIDMMSDAFYRTCRTRRQRQLFCKGVAHIKFKRNRLGSNTRAYLLDHVVRTVRIVRRHVNPLQLLAMDFVEPDAIATSE